MPQRKNLRKTKEGNIIIRLHKLYGILGVLIMFGGIALLIFAYLYNDKNARFSILICSLIALSLGLLLYAKSYISKIVINDSGLSKTTIFGKIKDIKYSEIKNISFGIISLELKISGNNSKKIKAHLHTPGFQKLVEILEIKTGKSRSDFGLPG